MRLPGFVLVLVALIQAAGISFWVTGNQWTTFFVRTRGYFTVPELIMHFAQILPLANIYIVRKKPHVGHDPALTPFQCRSPYSSHSKETQKPTRSEADSVRTPSGRSEAGRRLSSRARPRRASSRTTARETTSPPTRSTRSAHGGRADRKSVV